MAKIIQYTNDGTKAVVEAIKVCTSFREARGHFEIKQRRDMAEHADTYVEVSQDEYKYRDGLIEYSICVEP